jgi:hypothetical protein
MHPNKFVLVVGVLMGIFDLLYIWMLAKIKIREKNG